MNDHDLCDFVETSRRFVCIKDGKIVDATEQEQDEDFKKYGFIALTWYTYLKESHTEIN